MDGKAFLEYLLKMKYLNQEQIKNCIETSTRQQTPLLQMLVKGQYFTPERLKSVIEEFRHNQQQTIKDVFTPNQGVPLTPLKPEIHEVKTIPVLSTVPLPSSKTSKKIFGKYELLEELARGGMGVIYKARHLELDQIYALKVILSGHFASPEDIARFHQEAKLTAKLRHPNIVQVYDSGEEKGQHYLTMELIEGQTLKQCIEKKMPIRQGLRLFQKILEGLQTAHEQHIIHRDLKPANIFVTHDGEPKIGDFGLAKEIRSTQDSHQLTQTGQILGTPAYMSPEQAMGANQDSDARADIYSIGACLYELLTQRCTFKADTLHELLYKIVSEEPKAPSQFNKNIHRDLDTIVLKSLEKSKEKRYRSAKEFQEDIERFLNGYPILARPTPYLERATKWFKRNKTLSLIFITLLLLALFFPSYLWFSKKIERNHLFQQAYSDGKKEQESVNQFTPIQIQEKIRVLFKSLHYFNSALLIQASREVEAEKFKVGEQLIDLACNTENYLLAEYVASELQSVTLHKKEKDALKIKIEDAKTKKLKQHQERFHYWKEQLHHLQLVPRMRENAIFEIAKMQENEICQELLALVEEGCDYFMNSRDRSSRKDAYYQTMADALGRLENPQSAPILKEAIEKISRHILETKVPSVEKTNYLVALVNAYSRLRPKEFIVLLEKISLQFGKNSLFWIQCHPIYQELLELEDLDHSSLSSFDDYYQRGLKKIEKGDSKGAILDFTQAITLNPQIPEAYNSRGQAKAVEGDFNGAISDYTLALKISPQFAVAYCNRANAKHSKQDIQGAFSDYNQAILLNPQFVEAYNNRAYLKEKQGFFDEALLDYTQAIDLNPQFVEAYSNRGNVRYAKKDYEGAILDFTQAIQLNPQYALAYSNRGGAKLAQGELDSALSDYNQAIALAPQIANTYQSRAYLKQLKKDYEGAILDYTQALKLDPQKIYNYNDRGKVKYTLGEYTEAILDFSQEIIINPKFSEAYNNRGYTKHTLRDYDGAISDYSQAITLDPQNVDLYYKRGLSRWQKKTKQDQEYAKKDFQYVLQRAKNSKETQILQMQQQIYQLVPDLK